MHYGWGGGNPKNRTEYLHQEKYIFSPEIRITVPNLVPGPYHLAPSLKVLPSSTL